MERSQKGRLNPESSVKAFISHSHEDRGIAEALIPLVTKGLHLKTGELRSTSVPGYGVPKGELIADCLRQDLDGAMAVFALISEEALESSWVKFELGAAWATQRIIVTLLGPGINQNDERLGPIGGIPHISVESPNAEEQLAAAIAEACKKIRRRGSSPPDLPHLVSEFIHSFQQLGGESADFSGIQAKFPAPVTLQGGSPSVVKGEVEVAGDIPSGWDGFIWLAVMHRETGQFWAKERLASHPGRYVFSFQEGGVLGASSLGLSLIGCGRSGNRRITNWMTVGSQAGGNYGDLRMNQIPGCVLLDEAIGFHQIE